MKRKAKEIWILMLIFCAGLFLRTWHLSAIPPGLTPDEASQGYTAYSILETGRDEWGERLPLNLRSFGDYKPPLQSYIMIPSVAFLGLNETAVRLPNAILGSLAIVGVFLLASELFGNPGVGLAAAALLSFSPWHLPLSRGAFEANLTVFFGAFGFYFFLKKKNLTAAIFLGLNLFSYHSAKIFTPLAAAAFLLFSYLSFPKKNPYLFIKQKATFLVIFFLFFLLAFSSFFTGGQKRGLNIAIFNPTDRWQQVADERFFSQKFLGPLSARVFHNKLTFVSDRFLTNYLSYFSPEFLFSEGPGEGTYGMIPGRGVLWWWELPLLIWFFWRFFRHPDKRIWLLLGLLFIAALPAALVKGIRSANRVAVMMPWWQIVSAFALCQLIKEAKALGSKTKKWPLLFLSLFGAILVFFLFFSFGEDYFVQSKQKISQSMLYGRCEALKLAMQTRVKTFIVSRKLSEPQAYVMFCLRLDPRFVQENTIPWLNYEKLGLAFVDQMGEYHLGNFWFKEINWVSDSVLPDTALVGLPEEFPKPQMATPVLAPSGKAALYVYQTSPEKNE